MLVLAVGLRFVVVTDSELRAAMEATEAQSTTLCCPNGVLAEFVGLSFCRFLHLNGLHRTFLGAQTTTDTSILIYRKELGLPLVRQETICERTEEIRHPVMALVALCTRLDHRYHLVYLRLSGIDLLLHFRGVGEVKHRRPVVRHLDGETGVHNDAFALQFTARIFAYKALQEAIRGNREHIVVLRRTDVGFPNELAHKNRQFVPIGRCDEPERLVVSESLFQNLRSRWTALACRGLRRYGLPHAGCCLWRRNSIS